MQLRNGRTSFDHRLFLLTIILSRQGEYRDLGLGLSAVIKANPYVNVQAIIGDMIMEPEREVKAEVRDVKNFSICQLKLQAYSAMMPTLVDPNERSGEFKTTCWHQISRCSPFHDVKTTIYCLMNKFSSMICIYLKQLFDKNISDMYSIQLHSNFINPRY